MGVRSDRDAQRMLEKVRAADLEDRAIPLCELLPHLDETRRGPVIGDIIVAAQAVTDLHIRAKVLAEASRFAMNSQRPEILDAGLVAGRAAVRQTAPSLLGGPESGGIRGLLEVVPKLSGAHRRSALQETAALWVDWVDPEPHGGESRRRPHRRMLFDGAGDTSHPLVEWLATEGLAAELAAVLDTIRRVAGDHGNALDVVLAHTAWPALCEGDVEVAAVFVREAREETPDRARHPRPADDPSESLPVRPARFPDELLGFRNVWR